MPKLIFHLNCLEQGGAERVVSNLADQFAQEGYDVTVATEWQGENEFSLQKNVKRAHVGLNHGEEGKGRIAKMLIRLFRLRKFIRTEKPDLVVAFAHKAIYRTLMAALGLRVRVVIAVRTNPEGHYDGLMDKIGIPLLFPRADGCVFQTEGQRDFFPAFVRKKSRIILNPLNPKYIGVPKPAARTKTVVHSGRLVDFKNQSMLIRAFIRVHEDHPDFCLKLYGDDSHDGTREILESLIASHQAGDYVKLMGPSHSLEKELADAALYAFTSDWEGLPNALLEAMALGLPVVATDCPCGGPRMVIQDGVNGLLIPIQDEDALVKAMNRLLADPELAETLGDNARKISETINGQVIIKQWRGYFEELMR